MPALVRAAALTHLEPLAQAAGLDAAALAARAGLPLRALDDPDLMVSAQAVGRLLELAAAQARDPAFALRMAAERRLSNLGPLGLLVRDEPTLRHALEALVRHIHVHNQALSVEVQAEGGLVTIRLDLVAEGGAPITQATELALGVTYRVLSLFLGASWRPRLVCLAHRGPRSLSVHRRFFGPAVEFGHAFNGIVCNERDLDAPNPGADPVMARYTQRLLQQAPRGGRAFTDAVRQVVVLLLPRGHCRVERVAQHLGMDRRTVARHLAAEGTSFSALVDTLRSELLARYLAGPAPVLGEVALQLGFSAPSAFARWHRARFGHAASRRGPAAGATPARPPRP